MHRVISKTQPTLIKGRFILVGILSLHEIIHDISSRGSKAFILKLNFEKVYDLASWDFEERASCERF